MRILISTGAVILLAATAACSGGSGSSAAPSDAHSSALIQALSRLRATPATRTAVEFGDQAALLTLNGGPSPTGPFGGLIGTGEPELAPAAELLPDQTGISPLAATSAVAVGAPPKQVGVLYGSFDPAAIGAKLQALGYKKHADAGDTMWVIRDDHQIDPSDPLAELGIVAALNVVRVSSTRIAYGGASKDVDQALDAGSGSLASDAGLAAVATCLGDVKTAELSTQPGSVPTPYGFGVTATSRADAQDVLCVATGSDDAAKAMAASWTDRVTSGQSQRAQEPWSQLMTSPAAQVVGGPSHMVRLTARPVAAVDPLSRIWQNGELASLLGPAKG